MESGYYIFLGNGDYHTLKSKTWTASWDFNSWKNFIDQIDDLHSTTILIYLNGHSLPYPSEKYPCLTDTPYINNEKDFLPQLFEYIKNKKIKIIAVLTTTGHAGRFIEIHNEAKINPLPISDDIETTLISFPAHLRKNKATKIKGAAQVGYGVACHHHILAQEYAGNVLEEILVKYGRYFDGIALHPPESISPCICDICCEIFYKNTGKNLVLASSLEAKKFFILSYLKFQNEILIPKIRNIFPELNLLTFTIPWLFESIGSDLVQYIPSDVTLIDWDYNLEETRIDSLHLRINQYQLLGYKLWFMPTGGFSFDENQPLNAQISAVQQQVNIAKNENIDGVIYFLGPKTGDHWLEISNINSTNLRP